MQHEPRKEQLSDDVTLWLGDMIEVLPTIGLFSACVTDPPFGIGRDGSRRTTSSHGGRKAHEFLGWDSAPPPDAAFELIKRASKYQIIWGGNYFSDKLPPGEKWLVWDKGQRICQSDCELAYSNLSGALRVFELNRVALLIEGTEHPTQKPVELMRFCLQQLPREARSVIDPFMGSGSTGCAAVDLELSFVGIEKEPRYFDLARRRISEALRRPRLPLPEPNVQPKQESFI